MTTATDRRERVVIGGVTHWKTVPFIPEPAKPGKLRNYMGEVMREERNKAGLRLRDFDGMALGYLSEMERGKKEASSEMVAMYCSNIGLTVPDLLRKTADKMETL